MLGSTAVQVVLSHCGSGIVSEAVYFGKALVCLPVVADQVRKYSHPHPHRHGLFVALPVLEALQVDPVCVLCLQLDMATRVVELGLGLSLPMSKRWVEPFLAHPRPPPPRQSLCPLPPPLPPLPLHCVCSTVHVLIGILRSG